MYFRTSSLNFCFLSFFPSLVLFFKSNAPSTNKLNPSKPCIWFPALCINLHLTQLLRNTIDTLSSLLSHPGLDLRRQSSQINQHTFLLGVSVLQTHFLDANLAGRELVLAQDDGEGDAGLFGGLELLGELGLDFVGEFGLWIISI